MNRLLPAALALAAVLLVPAAQAHCGPGAAAPFARLLRDYSDECQASGGANDCRGAHELNALDIQEKWDGQKDIVVFRFILDRGTAASKTDVLTVNAPSGTKAFSIKTSDDRTFTVGTGFDSVATPVSLNDGTRFYVDATVALSKIGAVGDTLSGIKVEAQAGTSTGDLMPGGCKNTAGLDCPPPVDEECYYNPTSGYRLKGSAGYVDLVVEAAGAVEVGEEKTLDVALTNKLDMNQGVTVTISGADGVKARFHDAGAADGGSYSDTLRAALSSRQKQTQHLALEGLTAGTSGTLVLDLTTDAGGHRRVELPYEVVAGDGVTTNHGHATDDPTSHEAGPAIAAANVPTILLLAALAAISRRSA